MTSGRRTASTSVVDVALLSIRARPSSTAAAVGLRSLMVRLLDVIILTTCYILNGHERDQLSPAPSTAIPILPSACPGQRSLVPLVEAI